MCVSMCVCVCEYACEYACGREYSYARMCDSESLIKLRMPEIRLFGCAHNWPGQLRFWIGNMACQLPSQFRSLEG